MGDIALLEVQSAAVAVLGGGGDALMLRGRSVAWGLSRLVFGLGAGVGCFLCFAIWFRRCWVVFEFFSSSVRLSVVISALK